MVEDPHRSQLRGLVFTVDSEDEWNLFWISVQVSIEMSFDPVHRWPMGTQIDIKIMILCFPPDLKSLIEWYK